MDLNEMLVFTRVVQAGSFVGAARQLNMPKTTVSRRVSALEERLGARLLHRSTRKLRLTDVGQTFFGHAERVIAEAEEAELAVIRLQEVPRGLLRVTAPMNFGFLNASLATFLQTYCEVQLELVCTDRVVDLISEGFDVGLRAGPLADSSLMARRVGTLQSYLVASPAFLEHHGAPQDPEALAHLDAVVFSAGIGSTGTWRLRRHDEELTVSPRTRFRVNDFDFLDEAVLSAFGIALMPSFRCEPHLHAGRLVRLLPDWSSPDLPVHAVYPTRRHLSPKVKALLDHLQTDMATMPWM